MRLALLLWVPAFCLALCCHGARVSAQEGITMLKPDEFAILPWSSTPGDEAALKGIRECGFNLAGFVSPNDLDKVSQAGLKCIVLYGNNRVNDAEAQLDDKEIAKRVDALVARTANHPAVFGYYLRDEPGAGAYPGLGRWAAAYKKAAPEALAYINLLPNYASPEQMGVPTYEEYLESFIKTVKPKFISYDHYALMDDGTLRDGYFQNLEAVRKSAIKHALPFWNIVLSNAHFRYAEPTYAGLRFQLYTTLAYGARGISYFTYFVSSTGNYRLSPIDQFGHKTPTWDMLQNVNLQLHKLGPTYITLKSVNVFHHPNVPEGCSGMGTSRYLASVSGDDLLVGEFEGPSGDPYVIVVNKSLHVSTAFGVKFKEPGQLKRVNAYTGRTDSWGGEDCWLAPGQGMMLCLKKQ